MAFPNSSSKNLELGISGPLGSVKREPAYRSMLARAVIDGGQAFLSATRVNSAKSGLTAGTLLALDV